MTADTRGVDGNVYFGNLVGEELDKAYEALGEGAKDKYETKQIPGTGG